MTQEAEALSAALVRRALVRATLGAGAVGAVLGLIALGFLLMAGNRLDALTVPVVVLAALGQVTGLAAAMRCATGVRRVRSGAPPRTEAESAQRFLRGLAPAVLALAAGGVAVLLVVLEPLSNALVGTALGAGLLAQAVVVVTVLRAPLRRAARAPLAH